jgi:hypothetical protein
MKAGGRRKALRRLPAFVAAPAHWAAIGFCEAHHGLKRPSGQRPFPGDDQTGVGTGRGDRSATVLPERLTGPVIFLRRICITRLGRWVSIGFALMTGASKIRRPLAAWPLLVRRFIFDGRAVFKRTAFLSRAVGTARGFANRGNRTETFSLAGSPGSTGGSGASLTSGMGSIGGKKDSLDGATSAAGGVTTTAGGGAAATGGVALRGSGAATGFGCATVSVLPLSVALAFARP